MANLILPSIRYSQPTQLTQLASNWLGEKAIFAYTGIPNGLQGVDRNGIFAGVATGTAATVRPYKNSPQGIATVFHVSGGINGLSGLNTKRSSPDNFTAIWLGFPGTTNPADAGMWNRGLGNDSVRTNTNGESTYIDTAPAGYAVNLSGLSPTVGRYEIRVFTKNGSAIKQYDWRTGITAQAVWGNGGLRNDSAGNFFYLNHVNTGPNGVTNVILFAVFDALSDAEVQGLFENPWQIFTPVSRKLYVSTAAASFDLSGAAVSSASADGAITSAIPITGASVSVASSTGAVTAAIPLAGSAASVSVANGDVSLSVSLAGSATSSAIASGGISMVIPVDGAAQSVAGATGALDGGIGLSGDATAISSVTGQVSMAVPLSGVAESVADATGSLDGGAGMSGDAMASSSAAGQIDITVPLSVAATSVASGTGSLDSSIGMSGSAVSTSTASANLTLAITLSGSALNEALASAGIFSEIPLEGTAQSTGAMAGDLTSLAGGALAGNAQVYSSSTGQVSIDIPLAGSASAYAAGTGNVSAIMPIAGSSASVVTATGDLVIESAFNLSGNVLAQVLAAGTINITMPMSGSALAQALATAALNDGSIVISGNIMNIYCSMPPNKVSLALPSRKLILEQ